MVKRILVVDDDADDLMTMETILEHADFETVTVNDSKKAVDFLNGTNFDLIIMNIKMPNFSGYELLKLMRKKLGNKVPMVFVSILPEKELDKKYVAGFIQKPFSPERFLDTVNKVLENFKS